MKDFKVGDFFLILPQKENHLKHIEENDLCKIISISDGNLTYETILRNHNHNPDTKTCKINSFFINNMVTFDVTPEFVEESIKKYQEKLKYKNVLMSAYTKKMFQHIKSNYTYNTSSAIASDMLGNGKRTSKEINAISVTVDGFEYTPSNKEIEIHSENTWTAKVRQQGKFGKILKKLLTNTYTDENLERMSNEIKSYIGINGDENGNGKYELQIWKGEDIKRAYLESNYSKLHSNGNGIYGSCMRSSAAQNYLKLYTLNPEVCSIAVLLDNENKIAGRAIVWFHEGEYFMDRIYSTDGLTNIFKHHAKKNDWYYKSCQSNNNYFDMKGNKSKSKNLYIPIKYHHEWQFPYMDTLYYIDCVRHVLTNTSSNSYLKLRSQNGGREAGFTVSDNVGYCGFYKCERTNGILPEERILKNVEIKLGYHNSRIIKYIDKDIVQLLHDGSYGVVGYTHRCSELDCHFAIGDPAFIEKNGEWVPVKSTKSKPNHKRKTVSELKK